MPKWISPDGRFEIVQTGRHPFMGFAHRMKRSWPTVRDTWWQDSEKVAAYNKKELRLFPPDRSFRNLSSAKKHVEEFVKKR